MDTIEVLGRTYNRDQLATAVLLRLSESDANRVAETLVDEYGVPRGVAGELAAIARVCIDRNIEP